MYGLNRLTCIAGIDRYAGTGAWTGAVHVSSWSHAGPSLDYISPEALHSHYALRFHISWMSVSILVSLPTCVNKGGPAKP